ncbi:MAG: hypothetical protein IKU25_01390 [Clostridia bacterium]|nr:hypothetical protein [Clostridia bacterium]
MVKITTNTAKQLLCVCIPSFLAIAALIIGKRELFGFAFIPWIIVCIALAAMILMSAGKCGKIKPRFSPIIPVMIIFGTIVLCYVGNGPQYDETLYFYKALISAQEFNFSPDSFLALAWHKHPMIPYGLFITAGQVVFGGYETVIIQNLIISLVSIFCTYKIVLFYTEGETIKNKVFASLGAAIFAFSPIFITNCLCLNSDFPILTFAPIFICALLYNKKIVASVSALCLLFSKLPGTAIGIIIICCVLFFEIIQSVKRKEGVANVFKNRICLLIPLAIIIVYFIFFLEIWADSFLSSAATSDVPNCFTFDLRYIALKLAQIFIFQFNWIPTLIIIIGGVFLLIKNRISLSFIFKAAPATLATIVSFFAYLFYCLVYVTHAHVRYHNLSTLYLALFASVILYRCINIYIIRYSILATISLFMLSSFFFSSDFVSNHLFASYDFSGNKIINTHAFAWENPMPDITDSVVYNSKFAQLNSLYKKIHKEMEITTDDNIIHLNFSKWKVDFADSWKDGALCYDNSLHERSIALYSEDGYDMPNCYYIAERGVVGNNHNEFDNQYFIDEVNLNPDLLPDDAIIVLFPWQSEGIELFTCYEIVKHSTIEYNGFDVVCFRVSK